MQIVGARREIGIGAVPCEGVGVEIAQHVPAAGRVVDMVGIVMAAEGIARVHRTALCKVQMIPVDKLTQIGRADKVLLLAQCIVQIQHIQPQLVGHDNIHIIGTRRAIQWWPPIVSSHQISSVS